MAEGRSLRRIGEPVVAAAPAGVRIRTRLHLTVDEAEALTAIGDLLGSVYRGELAERIALGRLDRPAHARVARASEAGSHGGVVVAVGRGDHPRSGGPVPARDARSGRPRRRICAPRLRCSSSGARCVPVNCAPVDGAEEATGRSRRRRRGYASAAERFAKTRRLAVLRGPFAVAEDALAAGRPSITVGGKRLWRNRNHLDATEMTEQQWREHWDAARMFLTADGESGKAGGNETIRVDDSWPAAGQSPCRAGRQFGSARPDRRAGAVSPTASMMVGAGGAGGRCATTSATTPTGTAGIWTLPGQPAPAPAPALDELRSGPVLGVDLNDGHLATCVLDVSGNPIGEPSASTSIPRASGVQRDGRCARRSPRCSTSPSSAQLLSDRGREPQLR